MAYYFTPFRKEYKKAGTACSFCDPAIINKQAVRNSQRQIIKNNFYFWLVNYYPKFEGHTLIVPKRHIFSIHDESPQEIIERNSLTRFAVKNLERLYQGSGVEIFLQFGPGSASSIPHLHWHIVPAMPDDKLRSFEKLGHFYTIKKEKKLTVSFPITIMKAREELQDALSQVIDLAD